MDITNITVHELYEKLNKEEISMEEIIKAYKETISKKEKDIQAFMSILESNNNTGMPIAIKDNICMKDTKTTCSSKILENFVSPYDATVVEKLNKENLNIIAKTNMDEFAMGNSTENSAYKITKNPWNLNKVPGGSSGGSAAAVSANMVPWALGSDTGGSVRQPASFCGIVGLKPTYGLISRYGLVAYASSLDQIGILTKDVEDSAILLNIIAGYDPKDSTSANVEQKDYTKSLNGSINGIKIGIPKEYFTEGINKEVKESVEKAIDKYKQMGAIVEEFSLPISDYSLAAYYIIACAEASSNLGRFDGVRYGHRTKEYTNMKELFVKSRTEGFGEEVKRRIILGTYVLSSGYYDAYYKKAQQVRTYIINEFNKAFDKYDAIITPTSPTVAFEIGEKIDNPLEMYLADLYTVPVNVAGLPAISIPCGVDKENMPIGMQIIGKQFSEEKILNIAYAYEQKEKFRENYKPLI